VGMFATALNLLDSQISELQSLLKFNERIRSASQLSESINGIPTAIVSLPAPTISISNHCVGVTRLYAIYEAYVDTIIREWLSKLPEIYSSYVMLPKEIHKAYRAGVAHILSRYGENNPHYENLSERKVVDGFHAGLSGKSTYSLLPDAFLTSPNNYRWETLNEIVHKVGILGVERELDYLVDSGAGQTSIRAELNSLVDYRNQAAHIAVIDDILAVNRIIEISEYIRNLCHRLSDVGVSAYIKNGIKEKKYICVAHVIHRFAGTTIGVKSEKCSWHRGMKIAVPCAGGVYKYATIQSLEVQRVRHETFDALDGEEMGLELDMVIGSRSKIYLQIEELKGDLQLSADDDNNGSRILRLSAVKGYICARAEERQLSDCLNKISKLHDHEGQLTVTWKSIPTAEEVAVVKSGWASTVGDGNDDIESVVAP